MTAETVDTYRRDGAVVVRGAFSSADLALGAAGIDAVLADLGPVAKRASAAEDGAFVEDFCRWQDVPELEQFARTSAAAAIAGALTGSSAIRLYHDHVLVKEAGTRQRTPWHQDLPYYNIEGTQQTSIWLPVDPVPLEASLQVVAGSHRGPMYLPRTFLDGKAKWFPEGTLADLPDIEGDPQRWPVLAWALEPGDAVFFDMLALHGAPGFPGPGRRRVLSLRLVGDDVVHTPRPWVTSPPFPGLADELAAGAPLDHPLFPVLWRTAD
jgi:ectoine hydroxylase-related dioxygenase (phytanoyl-CoA dioxygenase family)